MTTLGSTNGGQTLYDRVGGESTIMAAVGILYERLMADEVTRPFFEHMDIDALVKKQIAFMAWALGGPAEHRGRDLRRSHAHLVASKGLTDAHFNAVITHLATTLGELGIEDDTIAEVLDVIGLTRTDVLDR